MTPEQIAAVMSCTPTYAKWSMGSRRALENRVKVEHANGHRAFIRSVAIVGTRTGVREVAPGETVHRLAEVGTRLYYLKPDNTVEHTDEWN